MTTWLTRQEKTAWFECYQLSLQNRPVLRQQDILQNPSGLGINIAKVSPLPQQPLQSIQQNHQYHGFICDIKEFLNRLMHGQPGFMSRNQVNIANLPFDSLDVFTSFKLTPIHLGDDASASVKYEVIKARPRSKEIAPQFDNVVILDSLEAESTGVAGNIFL
ncbi:hypothetical protein SERLADRAFT_432284 [Serpula lacrymans var. lacrymans S7.9]|uniref:Uncharacterized protein n=1 Tax=Serpula lacrymans var. lacrymans (strain S7.9) TaxID=578457 RepID=F8NEP2_SERL9|nr:uncharacterized protein SERLADRAFT_432284 [Serpula lacrymans var. lacrymans S7.9]EGO30676.1 hypothetical protein SERLADRAFT_432284 [Serpula lacrymans var. lacrymans S7.9]